LISKKKVARKIGAKINRHNGGHVLEKLLGRM
jgi:hypothetical protein